MSSALPDRLGRFLTGLLLLLGGAVPVLGQEVEVVASQVRVTGAEAGLELEFADGSTLEAGLADGEVRMDGSVLGAYARNGALERSWRALLGEAVAADNGALAGLIAGWTPPEDLTGAEAEAASALQSLLRAALERAEAAPPATPRAVPADDAADEAVASFLAELARDAERLVLVSRGLADMGRDGISLHLGEDVRVEVGEVTPGAIVVVDGELVLDGRVTGDALVVDGRLRAGEGGTVEGRILHARSQLPDGVSRLAAGVREVELPEATAPPTRATPRAPTPPQPGVLVRSLQSVGSGLLGLLRTGIWFLVLVGIGAAAVHFAPRNMDTIAQTVRHAPGYSALVGLAAVFLTLPVYVLGILVLTVSIVGILALPVFAIAFPVVLTLAGGVGMAAVAWNLGGWYAARRPEGSLDQDRPIPLMATGTLFLLAAFAAAHVVGMGGGFLGFFRGLLMGVGGLAVSVALVLGLGAVLLSWGGRDTGYARPSPTPEPEVPHDVPA